MRKPKEVERLKRLEKHMKEIKISWDELESEEAEAEWFQVTYVEHRAEEEYEEETGGDWRLCGPSVPVPVPLRQRLYNCYYKLI
ncbi:hypothetical protein V6N12_003422 [Hibiscus sabdariffa]|uniref:Uncharacterized protein n=1 Tax=Hibiscus sabdariffa TaxID=183260 RepID=A0ABR1ZH83_9ROSI